MNESCAYFAIGQCLPSLGLVTQAALGETAAQLARGKRVGWCKTGQTWFGCVATCLKPLKPLYRMTPSTGKYKKLIKKEWIRNSEAGRKTLAKCG